MYRDSYGRLHLHGFFTHMVTQLILLFSRIGSPITGGDGGEVPLTELLVKVYQK